MMINPTSNATNYYNNNSNNNNKHLINNVKN